MFGDGAECGMRSGVDPSLRLQEAGQSLLTTSRERSAGIFGWQTEAHALVHLRGYASPFLKRFIRFRHNSIGEESKNPETVR